MYLYVVTNSTTRRHAWRDVLRTQGRSVAWLASQTGTPAPTVYAYSRGARRPSDDWLRKAADVMGVPASLLGATDEAAA